MEKRKIRLIGLDLDGTVFNEKKEITQHTKDVIEETIKRGIIVMPATGRCESGLPEEFLQIPGVKYALTSNGARVVDVETKEVLYHALISSEAAVSAIRMIQQWPGAVWSVYIEGKVYVDTDTYRYIYPEGMTKEFYEYLKQTRIFEKHLVEKIEKEKIGLEKINVMFEDASIREQCIREMEEKFPEFAVTHSLPFNLEINSIQCGKGEGLLALGKLLGISREEIMACGDSRNDWDMLKKVGFPVVMANGDEETKKLAAYITSSNEEDGVAQAIEKMVQ